jgi:hypothetical protein
MMSNDALISDLSANLAPVRRRSVTREVALLVVLGAAELALFVGLGFMRSDMGSLIGSPYMLWKLGSLALLVAVTGATAIRSLSPTASPRRGVAIGLRLALIVMIAGALMDSGVAGQTLLQRLSPVHGAICSLCIAIFSLPMVGLMSFLMRRGAPSDPDKSAWAIGLAAGTWGAFVFAFCCPANDPLYVTVWYFAGCATVAALVRWLLPKGFHL